MILLLTNLLIFSVFFPAGWILFPITPRWLRTTLLVASILTILPALLYSFYYLHWFDHWAWFYQFRSWRAANYLPGLSGWTAGWLTGMSKDRWRCWLPATLTLTVIPFLKPVLAPLDLKALQNRWKDGICLQSSSSTCGPASVATILTVCFHDPSTERDVAGRSFTSTSGTEVWYLAQYLRDRGYSVTFHTGAAAPPVPSLAGIRTGQKGHFVAVLGHPDRSWRVADPLSGIRNKARPGEYQFTGFFMHVQKVAAADGQPAAAGVKTVRPEGDSP